MARVQSHPRVVAPAHPCARDIRTSLCSTGQREPPAISLSSRAKPATIRIPMKTLRLGTRKSQLALWQANFVRDALMRHHKDLKVELITMTTEGDRILDRNLATVGGKGLFIKELETGLLENKTDIAVHSLKDVTATLPKGLHLAVYCQREDPRDAFISNKYSKLAELPSGARVGTASLRRQCQLREAFPKLEIVTLRGNVNTRLVKLDAGEFDAILLAVAGVKRLGMEARIRERLDPSVSLPAVGQGAVCIECRVDDRVTHELLAPLNHRATQTCITAERSLNLHLEGGCQVPIARIMTCISSKRLCAMTGIITFNSS